MEKETGSELSSGMKINRLKNITKNYILRNGLNGIAAASKPIYSA
jgi:hypothetical protein